MGVTSSGWGQRAYSTWAVTCALFGCGEPGRSDGAEGDAGLAIVVAEDPGASCAGTAEDCGSLPATETALEVPTPGHCDLTRRGRVEVTWMHEIDLDACPFPPCEVLVTPSAIDEDGNLLVGAGIGHQGFGGHFGHGRLVVRYGPDGDLLSSHLEGFEVGHFGANLDTPPMPIGLLEGRMLWMEHRDPYERDGRMRVGRGSDAQDGLETLIERASIDGQVLPQATQGTIAMRFAVAPQGAKYADSADLLANARPGVARYRADGSLLYSRSDWTPEDGAVARDIQTTSSGMLFAWWYATSRSDGMARLTAFAPSGEPLWTRLLPDASYLLPENDDSVYVVAHASTFISQSTTIMKIDGEGDVTWALELPADSDQVFSPDGARGLLIDSAAWSDPTARALLRIDAQGTCTAHDIDIPRVRYDEAGNSWGGNLYFTAIDQDEFFFVGEGTGLVGRALLEGPP